MKKKIKSSGHERGESEALHNEWNLSIKLEWENPRRKYQFRKAWDVIYYNIKVFFWKIEAKWGKKILLHIVEDSE